MSLSNSGQNNSSLVDLIPLINKIQDVFNTIGTDTIDLPQIVVVGAQSSGKSSVLENIVQRDFLPRGSGIVTRRPLVLQLVNLPEPAEGGVQPQEYGEFLHTPNKIYYNFDDIRKEIDHETSRIAGANKGISKIPIHLKIYSPKVLNLTLVDLPGLTKIPLGDQPADIEKQTRNLIIDYISKPNSIILAVTPANIDLVNSDALKLARQVDHDGRRTIGVLTKLDLMDAGTNAIDVLNGRAYPLKLGFIGTVNRSQQDIQTNKPMSEALKYETEFFASHPAYRNIAHRCGTPFLMKQLNTILVHHIREKLPDMKAKLNTLIGQTQQELASYGDATFTGKAHRGSLILNLLTKFASDFTGSIDGTSSDISTKELCGGARIYFIFNNVFGFGLDSINPCSNLTSQDIRTAIRNSTGPRPSLFVPEIAFNLLVKPQIKLLEPPSLRCVELAYEELMKICHSVGSKELQRFPRLHAKLIEVVSELLRERLGPTSSYVESLISIERAYINTNHPDFLGAAGAMAALENNSKKKKAQERKREPSLNVGPDRPISNGSVRGDDDSSMVNGIPATKDHFREGSRANRQTELSNSSASREAFLNYFFGGGKSERDSMGSIDMISSSRYVPPVSMSNLVEAELERKYNESALSSIEDPSLQLTEREEMETQLIRALITSYFNIVRKTIQDLVPKAVMHLLVNFTREAVQNRLVASLYKEDLFNDLLQEDESLAAERSKCKDLLDVYKRAFQIINEAL